MKYGVLSYRKSVRPGSTNWSNIGDPIQSYATVKLLEQMGIPESEIALIDRYTTKSYDGDYVLLPYNCYNMVFNQYRHQFDSLPVSDKIIPVFISFHLHSRRLSEELITQFKSYEPIGCRDEETMRMLRTYNIRAYLSGCITATLPKRQSDPRNGKAYFIDCPDSLMEYIPGPVREQAVFTTHLPYIPRTSDNIHLTEEEERNYYNIGVNQLKLYENTANLVVTSRLHAAVPCMALGIPVILVSENFDGRFSWLDKYLPLYTPDLFHEIDWDPGAVDYEEDKKTISEQFKFRIKKMYEDNYLLYNCSSLYEQRSKATYNKDLIASLRRFADKNLNVNYALWGLRADTLNLHHVIEDHLPNWKLSAVIDQNSTGEYEGYPILTAESIDRLDKDIVYIVIPEAAHEFASDYLKSRNLRCVLVKNKTDFIEI